MGTSMLSQKKALQPKSCLQSLDGHSQTKATKIQAHVRGRQGRANAAKLRKKVANHKPGPPVGGRNRPVGNAVDHCGSLLIKIAFSRSTLRQTFARRSALKLQMRTTDEDC